MNEVVNKIKQSFASTFKGVNVISISDLNPTYWLVEASDKEQDYNCPFYAVDKKSYKIYSYNPIQDLDTFSEALEKRKIYGG